MTANRPTRSRPRRLAIEPLEDRSTPSAGWAVSTQTPANGNDPGTAIALDAAGNSYVSGYFQGATYFGATSLTSDAGSIDAYVAKLDPAGNFLWARRLGGPGTDYTWDLTVDPATGDVYATGQFAGTAAFGGTTLTADGEANSFVVRLDTAGTVQWVRRIGGTGAGTQPASGGREVVLDGTGHLYVGGVFRGTADAGPDTLASAGGADGYVARMTTQGDFVWARSVGGTGNDFVLGLAPTADGVYATGQFAGAAAFGPLTLTSPDPTPGFVTRLTAAGDFVWAQQAGRQAVAVDGAGNVYATHVTGGKLSKLDAAGNLIWVRQLTDQVYAGDLALDAGGNVYVGGMFYSGYGYPVEDFDPGPGTFPLTSTPNGDYATYDAFVWKLDPDGNFASVRRMAGPRDDRAAGLAIDAAGNVFATGEFGTSGTFDTGSAFVPLTSPQGSAETFVVKMTQDRGVISGRVFNDLNGNGTWDAGESPLTGQTVYLDQDQDGRLTAGEPTATADARGSYYFWHVTPGPATVRPALSPGWTQTAGSLAYLAQVGPGRTAADLDFGNTFPSQTFTYSSPDVPKRFPSNNWQTVESKLTITDSYPVFGVRLSMTSTTVPQTTFLIAPDGTAHGVFPGVTDIAAFNFKDVRGTWTLRMSGGGAGAGGSLTAWSLQVTGGRVPQVGSLTASPSSVTSGSNVTLTANNVIDRYPGGTVTGVSFYRDANGNGRLDPGADVLVGTDTNGGNGWSAVASTTGLAPGTYPHFAVATNQLGVASQPAATTVTVTTRKRLLATSTGPGTDAPALTVAQARPVLAEALSRYAAAGVRSTRLAGIQVRIADLGGTTLGLTQGNTIWLDADAAGWGWFVDPSLGNNSEFATPGDQGERGRMDLLTVLMHEVGHVLGRDHDPAGVMAETLSPGTREGIAPGKHLGRLVRPAAGRWLLSSGHVRR